MKVCVQDDAGAVIWSRTSDPARGLTAESYLHDGTQQKIIAALVDALAEVRGQLGSVSLKVVNAIADVGTAAAKVDCHVPIAAGRNGNTRG